MTRLALTLVAVTTGSLAACDTQKTHTAPSTTPTEVAGAALATGEVTETMNSGGYTYIQVDDGKRKIWAAAPQFSVAVGERVVVPRGMLQQNFESKTLNRKFETLYFVSAVHKAGGGAAAAPAMNAAAANTPDKDVASTAPAGVDLSGIEKADGGHTVAELFSKMAALADQEIVVRGRVTKYNEGILGKNWLHIQDGSGQAGTNDLTVTTDATAAVGNTVLVRGKVSTDKDFGAGYAYPLIVEDAQITVE